MARYRAVMRSATIKQNIANAGVPGVSQVWCHEIGGARMFHGVAIKQRYPGHAVQAGHIAAQCGASAYASKYIVVVRRRRRRHQSRSSAVGDADPHRSEGIDPVHRGLVGLRRPTRGCRRRKRAKGDMTHSVAIIDACRPWSWRDKFPPTNTPSAEVARKAQEKIRLAAGGKAKVTS
jgi:4-hydroxy-3-polyprenylbenzoate decarboxylase